MILRLRQKNDETNVLLDNNLEKGIESESRKTVVVHIRIIIVLPRLTAPSKRPVSHHVKN